MACRTISPVILAADGGGSAWPPRASEPAAAAIPAVTIAVDDPRTSDVRALMQCHLKSAASRQAGLGTSTPRTWRICSNQPPATSGQ